MENHRETIIIWVDSDPNVYHSARLLRAQNWRVVCFNETSDALKALNDGDLHAKNIHCIITSMMERGGRKERGCINGLEMIDEMKTIWRQMNISPSPLTAVISLTADIEKCKAHGVDIVVHGDYTKLQHEVIDQLTKHLKNPNRIILIGIAGPSGCGKTTYSNHLAEYLQSPFPPITLDRFFKEPISIDHPVLGRVKNLEQPETIDINAFLTLLNDVKNQRERSNVVVIVEGFLLFALSDDVTSMFDIRIFLNSTQDRCRMQRFRRANRIDPTISDSQVNITEKFSQWYDHLVWPEYLKRCNQQKTKADKVFELDDYQNRNYTKLDAYINNRLDELILNP